LVYNPQEQPNLSLEEIEVFLEKRKNVLEGICITGGEPTLQEDLEIFCKKVKHLGYLIKLDTNGYRPTVLENLVNKGLIDYVAMDIKNSPQHYSKATGIDQSDIDLVEESISILKKSSLRYEFRTTVVKGIHQPWDFVQISKWLPPNSTYFLQNFMENDYVMYRGFAPFSNQELNQILEICRNNLPNTRIRGEQKTNA
jgi:pyruvate formate lyase activating enzyme